MNIFIVDAFTNRPYRGNPAAVCLLDTIRPDEWMQQVANEMNCSETAFLYKEPQGYRLRWFTPQAEVDLCGHATLASAHILWEEKICTETEISFLTKSGPIAARKERDWIHMDFPLEIASECPPPRELIEGLGVPFAYVGKSRLDYLVEVENEEVVRNLKPDLHRLKNVDTNGIIVTSKSGNPEYDFVSRCFCPAIGIDEDPVTGAAHCCLGPYWMRKLNRRHLKAVQLSARQGTLRLSVGQERITISGQAVTTMKGVLV